MTLYDSHAHLDDAQFDGDRKEVIKKIRESGVGYLNNIGADMKSSAASINLAEENDFIYASVGVHPSETASMTDENIDELRRMAAHPKVIAIGEIGLDYHYMEDTDKDTQKKWLRRQLLLAKELNKPVIIHDRESGMECIEILKELEINNGVMHCFSGSAETAKELLKMGFYISFTGVLTFKNAKKAVAACSAIPTDRLLIETDCPYMAPEPYRGTRNDSSHVIKIAEKMAELKGVTVEEMVKITRENAKRLFGI